MKRLINKITNRIDNYKAKKATKRKRDKSFLKEDYFICRTCKKVLQEEEMNSADKSICMDCNKH